ncbi:MAG: hypothetical protein JJT96_13565 [Opitutales bacterium]|nr:hypothetical protein [Opitutales bacterium]
MDEEAMKAMRHIMRSQAAFAGMEVLTYCFMANHFHIFVRLDPKETEDLDDAGLVARFRALYGGTRCASLGLDADDLEEILRKNGDSCMDRFLAFAGWGNSSFPVFLALAAELNFP